MFFLVDILLARVNQRDIRGNHLLHQCREQRGRLPAQLTLGLGRVADQDVHLGGAEVLGQK